ncbi:MAG: hypothetical protein LBS67_01260 [Clostridiales Family XIII bacterium]|jgi:hypothetical protein|nr:hypothetical protein [Clostridiales Family XIII bacterium]
MSHTATHATKRRRFTAGRLFSIAVAAFVLFGLLAVYASVSTVDSYAAAKEYKVTITVKMGKNGSNCPTLSFQQGGKTKGLAFGYKFYTGGKKFDPWTKSKSWFKKHRVNVVFTTVKLTKGTYKVVCDNGIKIKTVKSRLSITKRTKKTVKF